MSKILHEPLVHFAFLGAILFAVWSVVGEPEGKTDSILITRGQIEALERGFSATWQRSPTAAELDELVGERIREEVWYRQAVAFGLDRDDPVIRRRLRQKMEYLTDDAGAGTQPDDNNLRSYLDAHYERYRIGRVFSFRHVYFDPAKRSGRFSGDVAELIAQLDRTGSDADLSAAGDPFLLEREFEQVVSADIAQQFGDDFLAALTVAELKRWIGPIPSAFGQHVVFVRQRSEERVPSIDELRARLLQDWHEEQRREVNEQTYQRLLASYEVTVESPTLGSGEAAASTGPP